MKYYKVISKENKALIGDFDYTSYLPKGNKKGKWLPIIKDIVKCSKGYHVTNYWNMWLESKDNRIFEVEVKHLQDEKETVGVIDKYVCKSFRFIKEIKVKIDENSNTGDRNTGDSNTGYSNTGHWNTGDSNTGDSNTGYSNTGDSNTGNRNTGDSNTGDRNTGDSNTGYSNTGDSNTGYSNTGDSNTGNRNTGNRNTGHWNTGDSNTGYSNTGNRNTGHWNTGHWNNTNNNNGHFNTEEIKEIKVFNKMCSKDEWDNSEKPNFLYFDIDKTGYKKSFIKSFKKANKEDIKLLINLPNFDYKVFEEISGITKLMITKKLR